MDWKLLIADLQAFGLSQVEIARRCGSSQSTISELAKGVTTDPRFTLGDALKSLRAKYPREPAPRAPGTEPPAGAQFDLLAGLRRPTRPRPAAPPAPSAERAAAAAGPREEARPR